MYVCFFVQRFLPLQPFAVAADQRVAAWRSLAYGQTAGVCNLFPNALCNVQVSLICLPVIIYPHYEDASST